MPTFKKNLIADCLIDLQSVDDQNCAETGQVAVTCESFELRINGLLDDRTALSSDPSLQLHADECLSCRQTLQQYEQLALVLGSAQPDASVEQSGNTDLSDARQRQGNRWSGLSTKIFAPLSLVALLALLVVNGQYFNVGTDRDPGPGVAIATADSLSSPEPSLPNAYSPELTIASSEGLPSIEQMTWTRQSSVRQLQGLVDSGTDLLAAGREQAAVIQGLSDVRLDLDLTQLEAQLAALQPVLTYSARIPVLSPMQGTVCFTLGWLKKGKTADQSKLPSMPETGAELGMQSLPPRDLA